jgi:hypothetical protein
LNVFVDCPSVAAKLKHPLVLFEIAYGLDDENAEMKRILERAFGNDALHLCFTEGDSVASVDDGVVKSSGLYSKYDVVIPLDSACKAALKKEYADILAYHATIPSSQRDYQESVQQLWTENPEGENPILARPSVIAPPPSSAPAVKTGMLKRAPEFDAQPPAKVSAAAPVVIDKPVPAMAKQRMAYSAPIDRKHPGCFLFLIDQSGSMLELFGDVEIPKANALADAVNRLLQDLTCKCSKDDGVRDYYDVGVIGYGEQVGFAFGGTLAGRGLVPISEVEEQPVRVEARVKRMPDGAGGILEMPYELPIWFDPQADGETPMCEAFRMAKGTLEEWIERHPHSYPPIVINITDGDSKDGDPRPEAQALADLATSDGNVLVFNCHISAQTGTPLVFASDESVFPDELARMLFEMSSPLPDKMRHIARTQEYRIADTARGFAFNANLADLIRFLDIGTRPPNQLR